MIFTDKKTILFGDKQHTRLRLLRSYRLYISNHVNDFNPR